MNEYINQIGEIPSFLEKYLTIDIMKRLKKVGYFCGMDYASKDVYPFEIYVSRYDHSVSTALLTWKFSKSKKETIAALFHDVATPCFSHVIDYMNHDYETQESTEEKTEEILKGSKALQQLLKQDEIDIEDIIQFKNYSIVDTNRPKLCSDRIDGILLTSIVWTKELKIEEVSEIINDINLYQNEEGKLELGFKSYDIADKVMHLNNIIDECCHASYDNYMMMLLADLTRYALNKKVIHYNDLYHLDEVTLFELYQDFAKKDNRFKEMLNQFETIQLTDIPVTKLENVKRRTINPLVQEIRYEC